MQDCRQCFYDRLCKFQENTERYNYDCDCFRDKKAIVQTDKIGWISVEQELPPVEERILLSIHRHSEYSGKDYKIVTCGIYEDGTVDVENSCWCCDSDFADYDEATDTLYVPKGWYEYHEYGDTENDGIGVIQPESCSGKITDKVTHWMPMLPNPYGER